MGTRAYKQSVQSENDNVGCMGGLIRIFHFRRSPKLLYDKKHGYSKHGYTKSKLRKLEVHDDADNAGGSRTVKAHACRPSIKTLVEEEMASTQTLKTSRSNEVERSTSDLEHDIYLQEHSNKTKRKLMAMSVLHSNDIGAPTRTEGLNHINPAEESESFPASKFIVDGNIVFNDLHDLDMQLVDKSSCLQKALRDVAEAATSQNFVDKERLTHSVTLQSEEFLHALKILSSHEELFLRLIQDPNSRVLDCLRNLQNIFGTSTLQSIESCEEPCTKQIKHSCFWKKHRSSVRKPSEPGDSSRVLSRIVILKPSPVRIQNSLLSQEDADGVPSHFSLGEIRRRLRHIFSDNQTDGHPISTGDFLHKIANQLDDFANENLRLPMLRESSCDSSYVCQQSTIVMEMKPEDCQNDFHNEAKKHLIERLDEQNRDDNLSPRRVSQSLAKLIYLPDHSCIPESRAILDLEQLEQDNSAQSFSSPEQIIERVICDINIMDELVNDLKPELIDSQAEESNHITEIDPGESSEIGDVVDNLSQCPFLRENADEEVPIWGSMVESESIDMCVAVSLESPERFIKQPSSYTVLDPVNPSVAAFPVSPDNSSEKQEQPSPVSVLEPCFADETINCPHKTTKHVEWSMRHSRILFEENDVSIQGSLDADLKASIFEDKEARIEFTEVLLELSGLCTEETPERLNTEDPLLDPSLFDELGVLYSHLNDTKLLFDCIEEVLIEIHNVRPAPARENLAAQVSKRIDWRLNNRFPSTLDQLARKDIDGGTWMDIRPGTEGIVVEIWSAILDDLLGETVFLWGYEIPGP